jgi:hypothetical protein
VQNRRLRKFIQLLIIAGLYPLLLWIANFPIIVNPGWENAHPIVGMREHCSSQAIKKDCGVELSLFDGLPRTATKEVLDAFDGLRNALVLGSFAFVVSITLLFLFIAMLVVTFVSGLVTLNPALALGGPLFMFLFAILTPILFLSGAFVLWVGMVLQHATVGYYCLYIPVGLAALTAGFGGAAAGPYTVFIIIFPR